MQAIAFSYIQHEFREHYDKCPQGSEQWSKFIASWSEYLSLDLTDEQTNNQCMPAGMSFDQIKRLEMLERTIKGGPTK